MSASESGDVMSAYERMSQAVRDEIARAASEAAAQAEAAAVEQAIAAATIESSTRMLAMVEATYLVAAADGALSDAEKASITAGMRRIAGDLAGDEQIQTMLDIAAQRSSAEGLKARAAAVAQVIQDPEMREAAFLVAAAASWLDRGIGVKQGLALQAVSGAFGIPMNEMHKLLGKAHPAK